MKTKLFIASLILFGLNFLNAQQWTTMAPMPTPRNSSGVAVIGNIIYVIGGANPTSILNVVEAYDCTTNTWTSKAPMSIIRGELVVATVNGKIYAIGGYNNITAVNTVEEYNPATNTWTTKANMPTARSVMSGAVINNQIYVVGGWPGNIAALEVYDPATNTWTTKASCTQARQQINGASGSNGKLYFVGGKNDLTTTYYQTNEAYDPNTNAWTNLANLPISRWAGAAVDYLGEVHYLGGSSSNNGTFPNFNTHYIYNTTSNTWTTGLPMLSSRAAHVAAVVGTSIYVIGGVDASGNNIALNEKYNNTASVQNLCTKTIQPYNVNVGDATHNGSTYAWTITPAAPNAVMTGNGTNAITIDWTHVPDASYTLQAIETSIEGCVSTAVTATINLSTTPAPTAQPQAFCTNATVANLVATGTDLKWYTAATGGTDLASDVALASGTYYVSQTLDSCESTRASVTVTITQLVTPTFTELAAVCSGNVLDALPNTSTNGITGTWSPALNNSETTTYTFTTNAGQCAATTTQTITITKPLITSAISFEVPVTPLPNVTIGTQVWASKNLDVSTYRDGTPIPEVVDSAQWANLTTGAWCYYNNDVANNAAYGKIYNWYAIEGIYDEASLNDPTLRKKLAPIGWHIPDDLELTTLTTFLGGNNIAGGKMKEVGNIHWSNLNIGANNSTGFTGLPGGYRYSPNGGFYGIGEGGTWWLSTDDSVSWYRLYSDSELVGKWIRGGCCKPDGFGTRLIKD